MLSCSNLGFEVGKLVQEWSRVGVRGLQLQ